MPTRTAVSLKKNPQKTEQPKNIWHYCIKPGHVIKDCRKWMKKEQEKRNDPSLQITKPSTSKSFAPVSHCRRTNHLPEKRWSGP